MAAHDLPLWEYAAGALPPDTRQRVQEHVAGCAECAGVLEGIRATRNVLDFAELAPPPKVDWRRVDGPVRAAAEQKLARRGWLTGFAFAGGAAVAACAVAVVLVLQPWKKPVAPAGEPVPIARVAPAEPPSGTRVESSFDAVLWANGDVDHGLRQEEELGAGDEVRTGQRGNAKLRLPDESQVRLGSTTHLVLAKAEREEVSLELQGGRVLVEASHAARKAFQVEAAGVRVHVVGTVFSVTRMSGREVEVAVAEGKVRVELPSGGERFVEGGERLVVRGRDARLGALSSRDREEFKPWGYKPLPPAPMPATERRKVLEPAPAPVAEVMPEPAPSPPEEPTPPPVAVQSVTPEPARPEAAVPRAQRKLPTTMEEIFLKRAEDALRFGTCEQYLLGLAELVEQAEEPAVKSKARILRARCYDDRLMPEEARREYRRYLQEAPAGEFAAEARRGAAE